MLALCLGATMLLTGGIARGAEAAGTVHVAEISGEIDLGLAPFLERVLADAADADAAAVVLVVDTPGGRLDAVLQMRDALLDSPVRTVAFVDRTAFSAGALIAIASEEIHVAPGAVIGAATPVDASGVTAEEKIISAVRSTFAATAEERGRDPLIAEAMVDPQIQIEGITDRGSLVTLSASEALEVGYADGTADGLDELLGSLGLDDRPVVVHEPSLAERLVRFITNPVLASLLITAGVWLLVGDLLSGGVGLAAALGSASLGLFFWGHLLAGLAGFEDVALLVLGLVLILVEVLVVPGFGVPGALGLAAVLGGSFLAMIGRDFDFVSSAQLARAATTIGVAFVAIVVGLVAFLTLLGRRGGGRMVLRTQLASTAPVTARSTAGWLRWFGNGGVLDRDDEPAMSRPEPARAASRPRGAAARRGSRGADAGGTGVGAPAEPPQPAGLTGAKGSALTDLRPAGIAEVGGRRVDVVTEGEYVAAGEPVEVLLDEGYRRVVRRARE